MALPLKGKVAIVTGSSRGIGKGIALCLAEDGADIVVCARSDARAANPLGSIDKTAAEIKALGRRVLPIKLDVTDDGEVRTMLNTVVREFGRIDIVVNNAARMGVSGGDYWGGSVETVDDFYRTNLRAPFFITQLVGPVMEAQGGGAIINISSAGANSPPPPMPGWSLSPSRTFVGYGITKAAMNRWVAGVAGELFLRNIAIVAVDPGLTIVERNIANPRPSTDYSSAETPETTGRAIAFICRDPMAYTGRVVVSRQIVDENKLQLAGIMPTL
jgi:dehydrogenase/reductase SDR family protein 1